MGLLPSLIASSSFLPSSLLPFLFLSLLPSPLFLSLPPTLLPPSYPVTPLSLLPSLPSPPVQELTQLQDKHATRPDVFDDVEEEQEIEILTQEITQVNRWNGAGHFSFRLWYNMHLLLDVRSSQEGAAEHPISDKDCVGSGEKIGQECDPVPCGLPPGTLNKLQERPILVPQE